MKLLLSHRHEFFQRLLGIGLAATVAVAGLAWSTGPAAANGTPAVSVTDFSVGTSGSTTFDVSLDGFSEGTYVAIISVPDGSGTLAPSTEDGLSTTGTYARTGSHEIGFEGTLSSVTTALTGMSYTAPASAGAVTISVSIAQTSTGSSVNSNVYYNSDNGHYYELVATGGNITWSAARDAAAAKSLLSASGYLATITSEAENTFIADKTTADDIWIGASDDVATVNAVTTGDPGVEGDWYWVTGPEAGTKFSVGATAFNSQYEGWAASQPDNYQTTEHFAVTNYNSTSGAWNDLPVDAAVTNYLVEYSAVDISADSGSTTATISVVGVPTVSSISPAGGTEDGGTFVTVTGTGFTNQAGASIVTGVTVGGVAGTDIDVISSTSLTFITPAGSGADQQVVVTTSAGSSVDSVGFSYEAGTLFPTVSDVSPPSGSVAGGTTIVVTGTGFTSASKVYIEGVELATTFDSETQLTAVTPTRTSNDQDLTVGAQVVQVRVPTDGSDLSNGFRASGDDVFFSYAPLLQNPNTAGYVKWIQLSDQLANRTQAKPLQKTGSISPYTMSGYIGDRITPNPSRADTLQDYIDAGRTAYSYQTDSDYRSDQNRNGREGWQITTAVVNAYADLDSPPNNDFSASLFSEGAADESWLLSSDTSCSGYDNHPTADDKLRNIQAYCTIFGPQLLSEPFYATVGQSISFTWKASGGSDDYEVYAYLVKVTSQSDVTLSGAHTTILHSRGEETAFTTTAASIPESALYRFRFVNGTFDATGGKALGADMYVRTSVVLGRSNTITFPAISDRTGSDPDPFTVTASASSGEEVTISASGACSVTTSHSGETTSVVVTRSSVNSEACVLTASQGQQGLFAPASSVTRTFNYPTVTTPNEPTSISAQSGNQQATISFTAPSDNGGIAITNYEYQLDGGSWVALDPASTATSFIISELINGTEYSVKIRAVNLQGAGTASEAVTVTPAAPPRRTGRDEEIVETPVLTPQFAIPRTNVTANLGPTPTLVQGPVLVGGQPPSPSEGPTARNNGQLVPISTQAQGDTGIGVQAGGVRFGLSVQSETEGRVTSGTSGTPELEIVNGRKTQITGLGSQPGSVVQVFLPLNGTNSREVAQIPVNADGSFSGEAVFGPDSDGPLPIGRTVLQVVTTDRDGNQTVVDLPINVAQPPPAPEFDSETENLPQLQRGQSFATRAGVPVPVRVVAEEDNAEARVEGDGWTMAVNIEGEGGQVSETADGGALLELVRDESARIRGDGFMPGTRADVWLFSEPTLLGTITIANDGTFDGTVNVDGNVIAVGEHTLQLQGVGEDGFVRAANLGVVVADPSVTTTESSSMNLLWWVLGLFLILVAVVVAGYLYWRRSVLGGLRSED